MRNLPILARHSASPTSKQLARVAGLAEQVRREQPKLTVADRFRPLVIDESIDDAPSLHLDDLSEIPFLDRFYDVTFLQDRARLRAGDGDVIVTCGAPDLDFRAYARDALGLGDPRWLSPASWREPVALAVACWRDPDTRRELVRLIRDDAIRYIHPHLGSFGVWAVASLLRESSRGPLQVIAPHPGLARCVNHKVWFADVVKRLFGPGLLPPTTAASNYATLAAAVREFSASARRIVVKLPDSAGGSGNVVFEARQFRGLGLGEIRGALRAALRDLGWGGRRQVLVGTWETDVLCAPSVQLWIPPESAEDPVIEGVFEQMLEGPEGYFVGNRPARLPSGVIDEAVTRCWLVGRLFQRLGYVGRCSFDLVLAGRTLDSSRVEFIECNGRWGGTSGPMTLVNRLFRDTRLRPYATRECCLGGLEHLAFRDLLAHFGEDLLDVRTGKGSLILFNPRGMRVPHGIDVLAFADSLEAATRMVQVEFPARLAALADAHQRATPAPPARAAPVSSEPVHRSPDSASQKLPYRHRRSPA